MKPQVIFLGAVLSMGAGCVSTSQAPARSQPHVESATTESMALEVVMRPLCLISTVAGSAIYVATLPFSSASGSDQEAKRLLVDKPFAATFKRKLGDFQRLEEINKED